MMSSMSDAKGAGRSASTQKQNGVLVNLPRTRPQRSTPRRTAARKTAGRSMADEKAPTAPAVRSTVKGTRSSVKGAPAQGRSRKPTSATRQRSAREARRPGRAVPRPDAAPRQGFESETDTMSGPVQPPGNAEFIASAAEVVGELAKAGFSTGERVLRDVLSRLAGS
jgi:hypothetical protein